MRRLLPLAAIAVVCAIAAATAGAAAAPVIYRDQDTSPTPAGSPDVGAVAVTNDAATAVVAESFAVQPTAGSPWYSTLFIDTDQNPATGSLDDGGVELAIDFSAADDTFAVYLWSGSSWKQQLGTGTRLLTSGGVLTWVVPRTLLGTSSGFSFWIRSGVDSATDPLYDEAPDTATWNYQFQKDTTATPSTPSTPSFLLSPGTATMGPATAGTKWSATLQVIRSDSGADLGKEGHVTCVATIGGATLHVAHAGFTTTGKGVFKHTVALCTWSLPASAHGKTIHAVVTTTFQGATASHTFTKIAV